MMKIVNLVSLLVFCQAISDQPPQNVKAVIHQGNLNEVYFVVSWDKVNSTDDDPIVGYKVKVYEGKLHTEEKKNGNKTIETVEPDSSGEKYKDIGEFKVSANKTEYTYHDMKEGVIYEVAVQAYSDKHDGPLSKKKGFSFF